MKKTAALCVICALLLAAGGCVARTEPPEGAASPAPELTAAPTPSPSPTPAPTPTPSPSPTPEPSFRLVRGDAPVEYTLFVGASDGAAALRAWLLGEGAEIAAAFVPEGGDEPIFTLKADPALSDIRTANDAARQIRLATDRLILESGLLEAVLPGFESRCGYVVEVVTGDENALDGWADSACADVALLSGKTAAALNRRGFAEVTPWLVTEHIIEETNTAADTNDISGQTPGGGES